MTEEATNDQIYDEAAEEVVELANQLANKRPETDIWDVADGVLAGAVHYWLYAHQPCEDPMCADCASVSSAEQRLAELLRMVGEFAQESEYYHSPNDSEIGRA